MITISEIQIDALTIPVTTETPYTIPEGWSVVLLQVATATDVQMAVQSGQSNLKFWTIRQPPARPFDVRDLLIKTPRTLYFYATAQTNLQIMLMR